MYFSVSIVVHGWLDNDENFWFDEMLRNLQVFSRGCVIFVDHSYYTRNFNVLRVFSDEVHSISNIMVQKIKQIGNYDRIYMFGISLGGQIAIEAAYRSALEGRRINRLEVCDTAEMFYDENPFLKFPMKAAKSVSCIHTSRLGKSNMKCHQNFRLGVCGYKQNYNIPFNRMNSHGICQVFYNQAFKVDMIPVPVEKMKHKCITNETLPIADLNSRACQGVKMGYDANFDRENCVGNFFIETDEMIYQAIYINYLRKHENRGYIQDFTLIIENSWNRLAKGFMNFFFDSDPFPY